MQVANVIGVPSTTNAASADRSADATVGYEAFLSLLVAQLKNQDPMQPMDATQYVSQLATLSNLEQMIKQNEKLEAVISTNNLLQAEAVIGATVTTADGGLSGVVVSSVVTSQGVVVTLESGDTLLMGPGVTVSRA